MFNIGEDFVERYAEKQLGSMLGRGIAKPAIRKYGKQSRMNNDDLTFGSSFIIKRVKHGTTAKIPHPNGDGGECDLRRRDKNS